MNLEKKIERKAYWSCRKAEIWDLRAEKAKGVNEELFRYCKNRHFELMGESNALAWVLIQLHKSKD